MKRGYLSQFIIFCALFIFAPFATAQTELVESGVKGDATATVDKDVGSYMDQFLEHAKIAADAAVIVKEADEYRIAARKALQTGDRNKARTLLRQAGEIISAAAPDSDEKHEDPFLRDYLREVAAELIALDGQANISTIKNKIEEVEFSRAVKMTGRQRQAWLQAGLARLTEYRPMMARIFREEGVPEWLLAVGLVESGFNSSSLSPKQALGIWQFIPDTGKRYGLLRTAYSDERQDPEKSTRAAARYLRDLYALFGDWPLAIAAYNTGENRVARVIRQSGVRDFWTMAKRRLLPLETLNYVPAVLAASRFIDSELEQITKMSNKAIRRK